jgi:hypothetical protein
MRANERARATVPLLRICGEQKNPDSVHTSNGAKKDKRMPKSPHFGSPDRAPRWLGTDSAYHGIRNVTS